MAKAKTQKNNWRLCLKKKYFALKTGDKNKKQISEYLNVPEPGSRHCRTPYINISVQPVTGTGVLPGY